MSAMSPGPSAAGPSVRVRAPSKVNLYLAVGDVRDDGYHDLVTVFHALDLADELTVSPARRNSVRCTPADGVPGGAKNLAGVAVRLLAQRAKGGGPVAVEIEKQIPWPGEWPAAARMPRRRWSAAPRCGSSTWTGAS
jgi:4-diphosphocytidyl-2-C-methyl-D-erythritol kinase